jgi:hypothetical protein
MTIKELKELLSTYNDEEDISIFEGYDRYHYPMCSSRIRIIPRSRSSIEAKNLILVGDSYYY